MNNRIEFVHTRDVGLAVANAASSGEVWGKILLIGGGPRCQHYYGEIVETVLGAMGLGMLPHEAFATTPFCTDWLDTAESQALLHYQRRCLHDYAREMAQRLGPRRFLIWLFRPFVRRWLLSQSPYYASARANRQARARLELSA